MTYRNMDQGVAVFILLVLISKGVGCMKSSYRPRGQRPGLLPNRANARVGPYCSCSKYVVENLCQ